MTTPSNRCGRSPRAALFTRTYLIIDRTMRYVQNTIAARREVRSILVVLTSRTTQRRRVRSRREEQGPAKPGAGPHGFVGCDGVAGHEALPPAFRASSRSDPHRGPSSSLQRALACQWMRPRSEMQRTAKARSIAHFCGRIPTLTYVGPLLRAPVRGVTRRDGGCDSVREALVREQTHKPRFRVVAAASAPLPAPLFESPSPGRYFRPRRCCSLLVWTCQTASLAPSRKRKSLSSHARAIMR